MKKLLGALGVSALAIAALLGQAPTYKVVSRATPPPREALARLGLVAAWQARVPVTGQRDGLFSVQVIPGERTQVVVQTFGGLVALLDGETGDMIWRTQVGIPGWVTQPVGASGHSIFVTRRHELHVLNRRNGYERVYNVDRGTGVIDYGMPLVSLPSAAPVAADDFVYCALSTRLVAYALPVYEAPKVAAAPPGEAVEKKEEGAAEPAKEEAPAKPAPTPPPGVKPEPVPAEPARPTKSSLQPVFAWSYNVGADPIQQPPILGGNQVGAIGAGGETVSVNRFEGKYRHDYRIPSHISRPAGQHGATAYIPGDDTYLYALNLETGELLWRFLSTAPFTQRPAALDNDLYVALGRDGLVRLQRGDGLEVWRNRQVETFIAANRRFVYALDRVGNLHILDGLRGATLAQHDVKDWNLPVANEWTDRIYLAGLDGQILCLRHRDQVAPLPMKSTQAKRKVEPNGEEKKPAEDKKPADEKKDEKGAWQRPGRAPHAVARIAVGGDSTFAPAPPRLEASLRAARRDP